MGVVVQFAWSAVGHAPWGVGSEPHRSSRAVPQIGSLGSAVDDLDDPSVDDLDDLSVDALDGLSVEDLGGLSVDALDGLSVYDIVAGR